MSKDEIRQSVHALITTKWQVLMLKLEGLDSAGCYELKCLIQDARGKWWFKTKYSEQLLAQLESESVKRFILNEISLLRKTLPSK
jgi:23S rRNA maturation-related 3'-5' exoribonuclease YhaM